MQQCETRADGPNTLRSTQRECPQLVLLLFPPCGKQGQSCFGPGTGEELSEEPVTLLSTLVLQAQGPSQGRRAPKTNPQVEKVFVLRGRSSKYRTHFGGTFYPLSCMAQTELLHLVRTNGHQGRKQQEMGIHRTEFDKDT